MVPRPTTPYRAIVCEGSDDVTVLKTLLLSHDARIIRPEGKQGRFDCRGMRLTLESSGGKDQLAQRVLDVAGGTAGARPDAVLVSFDPDAATKSREFAFFVDDVRNLRDSGPVERDEEGYFLRVKGREVRIISAPWRSEGSQCFAGLPDENCLERLLIEAIVECGAAGGCTHELGTWATTATNTLYALVRDHGYKRAFRIWNAALCPSTGSFVAGLLDDAQRRSACLRILHSSEAGRALAQLLDNSGG